MSKDPTLKTILEVIYYIPDHRPTAPTPLVAQGFVIDIEAGDAFLPTPEADLLSFHEKRKDLPPVDVRVVVPKGGYLYRMERQFVRKRLKSETVPVD